MFTRSPPVKSAARAAILALALGAAAMLASPAQAQSFNFSLEIPGSGGASVQSQFGTQGRGHGGGWQGGGGHGHGGGWAARCLTDREVRSGIAAYGYYQVQVVEWLRRNRVIVEAVYGNWLYSMRVDKCTGQVDRVERIARVGRDDWYGY